MVALLQSVSGSGPTDLAGAQPASTVIAVIVPGAASSSMRDALSRLRGEADSVGFAIRIVESPAGVDPLAELDSVASGMAPAAVVALVEQQPGQPLSAIDVWFLDRATGKRSVGHLMVGSDAGDRAELALAVRVVDFIRARMFDSLVRASAKPRPEPVRRHEIVGRNLAAAGALATGSFSGFATAVMPTIEVGYGLAAWLRLCVGAGGFGSNPRTEAAAGSATIDQKLLTLGLGLRARPWWRFFPTANTGLSALFLSVHGEGKPGYLGHDASSWSPGAFASAGVGVVVASHVVLQISAGGTLLLRQPRVFINDVEVARTGRPAWLGNSSLGVTF